MYFPSNLRTFCVISFTDSADVGIYCENLRIYCVCNILYKWWNKRKGVKQKLFIA